jgi:hypothetical protein
VELTVPLLAAHTIDGQVMERALTMPQVLG